MDGFLLVDKPLYWSSYDVIRHIKKIMAQPQEKIGHTGTLDPIAQGLLILCFGKNTRSAALLINQEKEYFARIRLGETRDTDDITGRIVSQKSVEITEEKLKETLQSFTGEILQIPPMYSAIKVEGVKLYKLARRGQSIKIKPRKINIKSITLQKYNSPVLELKVVCSKGTYIRALARDVGEKLGCGACMEALTRTRIGKFALSSAVSPKTIKSAAEIQERLINENN